MGESVEESVASSASLASSAFRLHSREQTSWSVRSHTYWPNFPQITQNGPRMGAAGASLENSMMGSRSDSIESEGVEEIKEGE